VKVIKCGAAAGTCGGGVPAGAGGTPARAGGGLKRFQVRVAEKHSECCKNPALLNSGVVIPKAYQSDTVLAQ